MIRILPGFRLTFFFTYLLQFPSYKVAARLGNAARFFSFPDKIGQLNQQGGAPNPRTLSFLRQIPASFPTITISSFRIKRLNRFFLSDLGAKFRDQLPPAATGN